MKWTNEPPKETGWYWVRKSYYAQSAIIVCVEYNYKKVLSARCEFANRRLSLWTKDGYDEWAGPIPEPEEEGE